MISQLDIIVQLIKKYYTSNAEGSFFKIHVVGTNLVFDVLPILLGISY